MSPPRPVFAHTGPLVSPPRRTGVVDAWFDDAMHLAYTPEANELLATSPLALLIGMLLDQQIPMEKAFTSPYVLAERLGRRLDAHDIAAYDPDAFEEIFRTPPALHRFPAAMAKRVQELCRILVDRFDGDAAAVWTGGRRAAPNWSRGSASCPASASRRRRSSPPCSASSSASGRAGWREAAGDYGEDGTFRSVADVVDDESLAAVRAYKKEMKAAAKAAGSERHPRHRHRPARHAGRRARRDRRRRDRRRRRRIAWVGPRPPHAPAADERVDSAAARCMPGFVDSHAHLVFAGDRGRGVRRPDGRRAVRRRRHPHHRRRDPGRDRRRRCAPTSPGSPRELLRAGVTTFECKSGYGLDVDTEAAVAAHRARVHRRDDVPRRARRARRASTAATTSRSVTGPMLDACAPHARWVDVFCEQGAFDADEARAVLTAGMRPRPRRAACTPTSSRAGPGVQLAVELGAASADHCTHLADGRRRRARRVATRSRRCCRWPSSRRARRTPTRAGCSTPGATVALATDCNPGSAYSTSMPLAIALAVREMRMTPAEAVHAATARRGAGAAPRRHRRRSRVGYARRLRRARRTELRPPRLPARGPARRAVWRAGRRGTGLATGGRRRPS